MQIAILHLKNRYVNIINMQEKVVQNFFVVENVVVNSLEIIVDL